MVALESAQNRPRTAPHVLHLLQVGEDFAGCSQPFGGASFHEALEVLRAMLAGEVDVPLPRLFVAAEGGVLARFPVGVGAAEVRVGERVESIALPFQCFVMPGKIGSICVSRSCA